MECSLNSHNFLHFSTLPVPLSLHHAPSAGWCCHPGCWDLGKGGQRLDPQLPREDRRRTCRAQSGAECGLPADCNRTPPAHHRFSRLLWSCEREQVYADAGRLLSAILWRNKDMLGNTKWYQCPHLTEQQSSLFSKYHYQAPIKLITLIFLLVFYHSLGGLHSGGCRSCGDLGIQTFGKLLNLLSLVARLS